MPVSGVIEHAASTTLAHFGQHARQHWAQACPRNHARCRRFRKIAAGPLDERRDAICTDIAVEAVDFRRACHAKTIGTETARDDLCAVIEQADPWRRLTALVV